MRTSAPDRRRRTRPEPRAHREGAAAVEFAIVATPFFFLIFAIMELALLFFTSSVLENATSNATRLVRTGRTTEENITRAEFKTALCAEMGVLAYNCESRTDIDVRTVPQFTASPPPDPLASGEMDESQLQYFTGAAGSLVLVRVWYSLPLISPMLSQAVTRTNEGDAVISVATAFRNEPF